VKLIDKLGATDAAKPGPADGRLVPAAGASAQEIGGSASGQVADAVGHIPAGDAAVLSKTDHAGVDDSAENATHGCLHISHGFENNENKADEGLVEDSN